MVEFSLLALFDVFPAVTQNLKVQLLEPDADLLGADRRERGFHQRRDWGQSASDGV